MQFALTLAALLPAAVVLAAPAPMPTPVRTYISPTPLLPLPLHPHQTTPLITNPLLKKSPVSQPPQQPGRP